MLNMRYDSTQFPRHCGTMVLYNFLSGSSTNPNYAIGDPAFYKTGIAIYINRPDQKRAYDAFKKRYKILYQSPVLVNPNTDREYFIVIYLNEKP